MQQGKNNFVFQEHLLLCPLCRHLLNRIIIQDSNPIYNKIKYDAYNEANFTGEDLCNDTMRRFPRRRNCTISTSLSFTIVSCSLQRYLKTAEIVLAGAAVVVSWYANNSNSKPRLSRNGFPKLPCRHFSLISEILRHAFELLAFALFLLNAACRCDILRKTFLVKQMAGEIFWNYVRLSRLLPNERNDEKSVTSTSFVPSIISI